MRLFISIILSFFVTYLVSAQHEWAPIGAKWYYSAPWTGHCIKMQSIGDTIINNLSFRIVEFNFCGDSKYFCREYYHQNGDSIFYYNYYHKSKYLMYNFAAKAGDSVIVHNDAFRVTDIFRLAQYNEDVLSCFKYRIENVDSVLISGIWLKRQKIRAIGDSEIGFYHSFRYLTEKLGSEMFPVGRPREVLTTDEIDMPQLRCYSDSGISYVNPNWNYVCNFILSHNADLVTTENVELFPNPVVNNCITITSPSLIKRVVFYDLQGVTIYETYPMEINPTIELSFIPKGIHLVVITTFDNRNPIIRKLVKK
jgi:hypothetical protein